jgi:hypothetical protein
MTICDVQRNYFGCNATIISTASGDREYLFVGRGDRRPGWLSVRMFCAKQTPPAARRRHRAVATNSSQKLRSDFAGSSVSISSLLVFPGVVLCLFHPNAKSENSPRFPDRLRHGTFTNGASDCARPARHLFSNNCARLAIMFSCSRSTHVCSGTVRIRRGVLVKSADTRIGRSRCSARLNIPVRVVHEMNQKRIANSKDLRKPHVVLRDASRGNTYFPTRATANRHASAPRHRGRQ